MRPWIAWINTNWFSCKLYCTYDYVLRLLLTSGVGVGVGRHESHAVLEQTFRHVPPLPPFSRFFPDAAGIQRPKVVAAPWYTS